MVPLTPFSNAVVEFTTLRDRMSGAAEPELEPEPVTDLPEGVPGVASDTSIHSWLQQFKLEAYAQPLADDGYDDLEHIKDLTEEEIDEVLEDVEMKKGHRRTFKREWNKLQ